MTGLHVVAALSIAVILGCGGKTAIDEFGGAGGSGGSSGPAGSTPGSSGIASSGIACGSTSCNVGAEDCCVEVSTTRPGGSEPFVSCSAKGACSGVPLACTSASNCANGEKCCADERSNGGAVCRASCGILRDPSDPRGGPGGDARDGIQLCTSDAECTQGSSCQLTPLGFGVCVAGRRRPAG